LSGGHQYAPDVAGTHVQLPSPTAIETMHCRRRDNWSLSRSIATGLRKATFTGPGPQPTMLL